MSKVSIKGLNKAQVLHALVNAPAKKDGEADGERFTEGEANERIGERSAFDSLNGVIVGVDLSGDEFDSERYDAEHGDGAAAAAVAGLPESGSKQQTDDTTDS
jgi:hypothetical protein